MPFAKPLIMRYSLLFLVCILFLSCVKDVKRGTKVNVSGYVIDTVKNKRLSAAKVYLVGCKHNFSNGSINCTQRLDSAMTDINGDFTINYSAEGNSVEYVLEVAKDNKYSYEGYEQFPFSAGAANIKLKSQELNFLRLALKVNTNPYDTLFLYPSHGFGARIISRTIDTSIILKVLPNNRNILTYQIIAIGRDSGAVYRRLRDTFNIGLVDTTFAAKTILNTYQMPLH
jgi:hypothetical protein